MEKAIYDTNKQIGKDNMNSIYLEFMHIFNVDTEEKLVEHLSRVNIASNEVCAKILKGGEGAWECSDCGRDSRCIICNDCYEKSKDKHKTHKKRFKNTVSGCCDCGDPDAWDPNGFCTDHGGIITSDEEINDLINNTFEKEILDKIYLVFNKLFSDTTRLIALYQKDEDDNQIKNLAESIGSIIKNLHVLAQSNNAILFIIVNYFMKNFPFETRHTCFSIDNDLKIIGKVLPGKDKMLEDIPDNSHPCSCYFLHNFIRICDENFDKYKLDKLLMPFLKSYKFKYLYSFSYISLYKEIVQNGNKHIENFSVQVLTNEDIGLAISSSEDLINSLFESFYFLIYQYIEKEEDLDNILDNEIYEIVFRFYIEISYLCKPKPTQKISQYVGIIKTLIDVLSIIQNKINFREAKSFQHEGFRESFITIEMYLLYLFSLLTTYFDFSNKKNADEIVFYLIDKIRKKKYYNLSKDEYSFHIPLNRALGIFLNRYSFYLSVEENYDFYMGIKNILYNYYNLLFDRKNEKIESMATENSEKLINYNFEDFLEDLIKEPFRTLGFINSIPCKNWVYYGENMLYYNYLYNSLDIFRLCDYALLKLILSQDQLGEIFNIEKILNMCNVNDSYSSFQSFLFKNIDIKDFKGKNLFVKIMDIIIRLFRNNSILLDLLNFSYDRLKENKCEDPLFQKLMLKEKNALIEDVKIRLIHIIISKENSIYFSEINKVLPFYLKDYLSQEKIEEIINLICDKVVNKNKTIMFRLKKEFFSSIDLYYITNPQKESSAERYLLEFKRNEICLLNTPHFSTFDFIKLVNSNMANHFFRNERNIDLLVKVTSNTLTDITSNVLTTNYNFVINFMKLIDIFVDAYMHSGLLSKHESKFQNKVLIDSLKTFKSTDENIVSYTKRLLERLTNLFSENEKDNVMISLVIKTDENEAKKQMLKQRKEKMAEMYKNKGLAFRQNFNLGEVTDSSEIAKQDKLINEHVATSNINVTTTSCSNFEINSNTIKAIPNISSNIPSKPCDEYKISLDKQGISNDKHMNCVICRNNTNPNEYLQNPFGRMGVFSKSNFIYHSKLQTLKKEYEKNILAKKNTLHNFNKYETTQQFNVNHNFYSLDHQEQLEMKELMLTYKRSKPELKSGIRYTTCNHYIHFSCYLTYILKFMVGNTESKQLIFICPLCKVPSNNYIPFFDYKSTITKNYQICKNIQSEDILSGIKFEELFVFYKEILSQNSTINHVNLNFFSYRDNFQLNKNIIGESFIPSISYFVEHIVSTQLKSSFLINDFKNKMNQDKYYAALLNFFINSLNLLDISKDDDIESVMDILKDYIIALRILIKTEMLDPQIFFNRLITIQFYWNTDFVSEENIVNNLENDKTSLLFFENLFLILVLFEESQFDYFKIIFRHFTPLIFIQFFLTQLYTDHSFKINSQIFHNQFSFENFMYILMSPEESESLKRFLLFYLRKILILKNIFNFENIKSFLKEDSTKSFKSLNSEFEYYVNILGLNHSTNLEPDNNLNNFINSPPNLNFINWLKLDDSFYPQFWIFREDLKDHSLKILNNYFNVKRKILEGVESTEESPCDLINPSLLLINNNLDFHFISIPSNLLDLSTKYYRIICNHCKTAPVYSLLCLTCGEKICYMENCCKHFGKKKNVYEYVWHNKICGNGDGVFLRLHSGEITYAFLGNFMNTKVSIYLNKYGESLKSRSISDDYLLNEDLFQSILKEYKNLKYRKNFKLDQGLYNIDVEEEELN